jgi:type IV pilus assembly protein PilQ
MNYKVLQKRTHLWLILMALSLITINAHAQDKDRFAIIEQKLRTMALTTNSLNDSVDVSVSDVSLQEFIRATAVANKVNISVDPKLNVTVVNNFNRVKFIDLLIFLVHQYDLDVTITGNIISIAKYNAPPTEVVRQKQKELVIAYNNADSLLTVDLQNDTLSRVMKQISRLSGKNIIISNGLEVKTISGFIQNKPVKMVIDKLCISNNLVLDVTKDGFMLISATTDQATTSSGKQSKGMQRRQQSDDDNPLFVMKELNGNHISVFATKAPIDTLILKASKLLNKNYHFLTPLQGEVSLMFNDISYEEFIQFLLRGTNYIYKNLNNIYIFGDAKTGEITETKVIPLQFRTVEKLKDVIPARVKEGMEIIEFVELNSFLASGSSEKIKEFENFIQDIDKVVPVVLIEVIMTDVQKAFSVTSGMTAGLKQASTTAATTTGTTALTSTTTANNATNGAKQQILPSIDFSVSTQWLNNLINSFNGFGWFKLGNVNENFYLTLKYLEDNSYIKILSTPRLSTLNGHEAKLVNGSTQYWQNQQSNISTTTSVYESKSTTYTAYNADMTISIKPFVSGDNQITLEIDVTQSDFVAAKQTGAPPGQSKKSFKSIIRVKDQEMVLLGGLEQNSESNSGSGLPLLSRIPVLKWFFSYRTKAKSNEKLTIFIKPTVIY